MKGNRYKHFKTGHVVEVLHVGRLQTAARGIRQFESVLRDMDPVVVYEHDGNIWVRSVKEFTDGRFERIL